MFFYFDGVLGISILQKRNFQKTLSSKVPEISKIIEIFLKWCAARPRDDQELTGKNISEKIQQKFPSRK